MQLQGGTTRAIGTWAALTLAVGVVATIARDGTPARETVAVATADRSPSDEPRRTTTTAGPPTTVLETTTTAAPVPETTAPPVTASPTTLPPAPPVEEVPVTEPPTTLPPAPTYTQTPGSLSVSNRGPGEVFHTSGEGCTGPGHASDEYGILGIVVLEDGNIFTGDRVAVAPGGHWDSTFFIGAVGNHVHRVQCTLLDGTVVFEYEPQPFTITP